MNVKTGLRAPTAFGLAVVSLSAAEPILTGAGLWLAVWMLCHRRE